MTQHLLAEIFVDMNEGTRTFSRSNLMVTGDNRGMLTTDAGDASHF